MNRNQIRAGRDVSQPLVSRCRHSCWTLYVLLASAFLWAVPVTAADRLWQGDVSSVWTTVGNWSDDTAPSNTFSADTAIFNLPVYGGNPVYLPDAASNNVGGISIGPLNGPMTIFATSLGIGSSGLTLADGSGPFQIASPAVVTNNPQTWTNNSARPFVLSSDLSLGQSTELTFAGTSSTVLNGSTTLTASRTVNFSGNAPTVVNGNLYLSNSTTNRLLTIGGTGHGIINGNIANFNGTGGASNLTVNNAALLLSLQGSNTYSGTTTLTAGTINANSATAFGASSSVIMNGVTLDNTSGKPITLTNNNTQSWGGTNIFNGSNDLDLGTGAVTMTQARTWSTTSGNLTVGGVIGGAGLSLTKSGSGTMTLRGANTYAGSGTTGTSVAGGNLVFDYAVADPVSATNRLTVQLGKITIKGKSSGPTADTYSSVLLNSAPAIGNSGSMILGVDGNGGTGVNLTITSLLSESSPLFTNLIDNSANPNGTISVTGVGSNTAIQSTADNIILSGNSVAANRRAATIYKDGTGKFGFAKTANNTGTLGAVSALVPATALTDASNSASTNYLLNTSGTLTRLADLDFNTLTIDSTAGAITLDSGSNNWLATGNGRAVLFSGSNPITLASSGGTIADSMLFHHYSSAKVTIGIGQTGGTGRSAVFGGTGFYEYTAPLANMTAGYAVIGSLLRVTNEQDITSNTAPLHVTAGGVLEIGADLNGLAAGDFTQDIAFNTAGRITFLGDAGLSASGAPRVVNFGGAGATKTWGTAGFLTNGDGTTDGGHTLKLSSAQSDATLTIQNPLALGTRLRIVDVANGSSEVDAILSGSLSGTVNNAAPAFTKNGAGTLVLSAANNFSGVTTINAGTLAVTGSLANNGPPNILLAAPDDTLAGNATITRRVAAAASYTLGSVTGLGSTAVSIDPVTAAPLNSTAAILAGTASSQADVSMQWRTRSIAESTGVNAILSDVVNLSGVAPVGAYTDVFLLEMSYTDSALAALGMNEAAYAATGILRLGWHNGSIWTSAIEGNSPASVAAYEGDQSAAAFLSSLGASPLASKLGSYGIDTANNKVWAVLNHNSEFAVIPEPSTLVFVALGGIGLIAHRLRRRKKSIIG